VDVYEQAPELTDGGGGINMGPNACRVLLQPGFGPSLDRVGVRPLTGHQRSCADGRTSRKVLLQLSWPLGSRVEEDASRRSCPVGTGRCLEAAAELITEER
jgi:2-polyprenyl-6-methoxyphenol hydroxylase-like FAD-dependent oxidoreductase